MRTLFYCPTKTAEPIDPSKNHGVLGSEISVILGIDPNKTAYDLYLEKVSLVKGALPPAKEYIEPPSVTYMAEQYARLRNKTLGTRALFQHKQHPFLLASPDRLVLNEQRGLDIKPTEASTTSPARLNLFKIPSQLCFQMAHHMLVLNYPWWDLVTLQKIDILSIYSFARNARIEQIITTAATEFWCDHVEKQRPPPVGYVHPQAAMFKDLTLELICALELYLC